MYKCIHTIGHFLSFNTINLNYPYSRTETLFFDNYYFIWGFQEISIFQFSELENRSLNEDADFNYITLIYSHIFSYTRI
jgi:hypothetical protein